MKKAITISIDTGILKDARRTCLEQDLILSHVIQDLLDRWTVRVRETTSRKGWIEEESGPLR